MNFRRDSSTRKPGCVQAGLRAFGQNIGLLDSRRTDSNSFGQQVLLLCSHNG